MKKNKTSLVFLFITMSLFSQNAEKARDLLDNVSAKMGAYYNMDIGFSSSLVNEDAGIYENDEAPLRGTIIIRNEKYLLDYLGNKFIFDGNKLYVINEEIKEVNISNGAMEEESGFIYPSKLLTFYKEGYRFAWGQLENDKGRKIQYIDLTPIDSNSEIVKVNLGIDAKTNHIYSLIQIGKNGTKTTLIINSFKSNQTISEKLFTFDRDKYLKQKYTID
jgi:hypothetical protein